MLQTEHRDVVKAMHQNNISGAQAYYGTNVGWGVFALKQPTIYFAVSIKLAGTNLLLCPFDRGEARCMDGWMPAFTYKRKKIRAHIRA